MNQTTEFVTTKEYRRFVEFCNACKKENYIGLCYGPAGVGKSMAAYQFARWHEVKHELDLKAEHAISYTWPSIKMDDLDTIIYLPHVSNSPSAVHSSIKQLAFNFQLLVEQSIFKDKEVPWAERSKQRVKLLIIDEADRLQPKSLEQIRDLYDRQQIAVILIGMPGIAARGKVWRSESKNYYTHKTKKTAECSGCGKRYKTRYDRKICEARDLDATNYRIYLRYERWRVSCFRCQGMRIEKLDWLAKNPHYKNAWQNKLESFVVT